MLPCSQPVEARRPLLLAAVRPVSLFAPRNGWRGPSPRTAPASAVLSPPAFKAHVHSKPKLSYRGVGTPATLVSDGVSTQKPALIADHATAADARLAPPPITKSDERFLEDGMEFVWGAEGVDLAELNDLFQRVGFPQRDPFKLQIALQNTYATVWVRAARKSRLAKQGQLLGFARATSDGALSATIWDVAVHPAWQRNGLGRALVERLTASLVEDGIATITLYAEPAVVGLYERLGYVKDPEGIRGLAFQSKKARALARA